MMDIWDVPYVQKLGLIDHCHEILALYGEYKAHRIPWEDVEREVADLYIIAGKLLRGKDDLIGKRVDRFKEKAKEDMASIISR